MGRNTASATIEFPADRIRAELTEIGVRFEKLLTEHEIPFDRTTSVDWGIEPEIRVFRPGVMDRRIPLDCNGAPTVEVEKIRELLAIDDSGEHAASAIRHYLDENFNYPPLADFAEADGTEGQDRESYTDEQDRESYAT